VGLVQRANGSRGHATVGPSNRVPCKRRSNNNANNHTPRHRLRRCWIILRYCTPRRGRIDDARCCTTWTVANTVTVMQRGCSIDWQEDSRRPPRAALIRSVPLSAGQRGPRPCVESTVCTSAFTSCGGPPAGLPVGFARGPLGDESVLAARPSYAAAVRFRTNGHSWPTRDVRQGRPTQLDGPDGGRVCPSEQYLRSIEPAPSLLTRDLLRRRRG